jgi:outer membrane immunogenic protein
MVVPSVSHWSVRVFTANCIWAKMKRKHWTLLLSVAPLALAFGAPARGADMPAAVPLYKAPAPLPYSWTGWYIGANAGYGLGSRQGDYAYGPNGGFPGDTIFNAMPGGGFGGGQIGYNYQINSIVLGLETDIQGSGISDTRTCLITCSAGTPPPGASALIDQKLKWFGTTRARLGWATGPVLTYVTLGAAYGEVETGVSTMLTGSPTSSLVTSSTKGGWTWGAGVEAALGGNWTAKAEYLRVDLGSSSASNFVPASFVGPLSATFRTKNQEQIFRGGVNYRFGPDQSAGIWPTRNWAGLFVGGTFGYGIARNDSKFNDPTAVFPNAETFFLSPRGFQGGGMLGYNWQFGRMVVGAEGDLQGASGSGYLSCVTACNANVPTTINQTEPWYGTVRGRLGYAAGPALFYATAGLAFGEVKETINQPVLRAATVTGSFSHSRPAGFAVGGGIENRLDIFGWLGPNWTTRTEYLYVDLGSVTDTLVNPVLGAQTLTSNLHEHVWRTVVSYKFGSP